MRRVIHLAADAERAGAGAGGEGGDDRAGLVELGPGRGEAGVDRLDLVGMDREAAGKAVAPGTGAVRREAGAVAIVGVGRVERRHAGRRRGEQALSAGELIGKGEIALAVAV